MAAPEPAANNLANLILALLAPMFLWSTEGDIRLAYTAAAQTLNEYRITNRLSLFTAAKIIAFDIATLSSLSLSMYEDVSMPLALRLRGNANSLDRAGERNRRLLDRESRAGDETDISVEAAVAEAERMVRDANARIQAAARAPEPEQPPAATAPAAEPPAPAPATPPAPAAERPDPAGQPDAALSDAMTAVTRAFTADLNDVPPDERWKEMARIMALTKEAADMVSAAAEAA
nr:hypothetical protein [uncultured Rhodopila sp.]